MEAGGGGDAGVLPREGETCVGARRVGSARRPSGTGVVGTARPESSQEYGNSFPKPIDLGFAKQAGGYEGPTIVDRPTRHVAAKNTMAISPETYC